MDKQADWIQASCLRGWPVEGTCEAGRQAVGLVVGHQKKGAARHMT